MASPSTYLVANYFALDKFQIVVYTKRKISCKEKVKVKGTVIKLYEAGKGNKVDET